MPAPVVAGGHSSCHSASRRPFGLAGNEKRSLNVAGAPGAGGAATAAGLTGAWAAATAATGGAGAGETAAGGRDTVTNADGGAADAVWLAALGLAVSVAPAETTATVANVIEIAKDRAAAFNKYFTTMSP